MQAGELMQDYKTGHLIRASPRGQFLGQLVGSTVGIFASTFAYKVSYLLSRGKSPLIPKEVHFDSFTSDHTRYLGQICLLLLLVYG